MGKIYTLPKLDYDYRSLAPYLSKTQLKIHHRKHHQSYVINANKILYELDRSRTDDSEMDIKSTSKSLSFNVAGHTLHSLFWKNIAPKAGGDPSGGLANAIKAEFGGFSRFKKEFSQAAVSCEGSGWAALVYDRVSNRLLLSQIEKHNMVIYPNNQIILVLDVWEHAYYIDYKNERVKFVEAFWNIVNWHEAEKRFKEATK